MPACCGHRAPVAFSCITAELSQRGRWLDGLLVAGNDVLGELPLARCGAAQQQQPR